MKPTKLQTGSWLVIALVSLGLILALIGLKFRRFPHEWQNDRDIQPKPTTSPASKPRHSGLGLLPTAHKKGCTVEG